MYIHTHVYIYVYVYPHTHAYPQTLATPPSSPPFRFKFAAYRLGLHTSMYYTCILHCLCIHRPNRRATPLSMNTATISCFTAPLSLIP